MQTRDPPGFDCDNVVEVLEVALNNEKGFLSDHETMLLEHLRIDDGIGPSFLVP